MSWRRSWGERLAQALPLGLATGWALNALFSVSPFPSEVTGALGIIIFMRLAVMSRWLARDHRRRATLGPPAPH